MTNYLMEVCKIGQAKECCRYLVAGKTGLECCKYDSANKAKIDNAWSVSHVAQGDNCEGVEDLKKLK